MADPTLAASGVVAAPGAASQTTIEVHTPAVDRLAAVSRKLRADVETIRKHPFDSDYKEATKFFGGVRALAGIIDLVAEQPGYRPTDTEGQAVRTRMAPLKKKMDEITKSIEKKVNMLNPLAATSSQRLEDRAAEALRLAGVLCDTKNVDDIKEVRDDKTIDSGWKTLFFYELGKSIHETMVEVLKTKHEGKMFDAVNKALDSHSSETMIGACLWASQASASAAGNLPGPNSLYVGIIRIRAISGLKELSTRTPKAVLGDILPHWFKALKLSAAEQAAFETALKEFNTHHQAALTDKTTLGAQRYRADAQATYDDKLVKVVKNKGNPQAGWKLSGAMTVLNLLCLLFVWDSTPDKWKPETWSVRNWADVVNAGANFGVGVCTTFVRWRVDMGIIGKLVEHKVVGAALGYFTAIVSVFEGISTVVDAAKKDDWWLVASGGFQIASGVLIGIGVLAGAPGLQLIGLLVGLVAAAIAIIDDAAQDKMVQFISQLVKNIKDAKSTYNNTSIAANLGLSQLVTDLEGLISSCKVTELSYDKNWTGPGLLCVSHGIVHDRLNGLGITDAAYRERLCRKVWR